MTGCVMKTCDVRCFKTLLNGVKNATCQFDTEKSVFTVITNHYFNIHTVTAEEHARLGSSQRSQPASLTFHP